MCLITEQRKPFIASRDITVYKEMNIASKILKPGFWPCSFVYEYGILYQTEILKSELIMYHDQLVVDFYGFKLEQQKPFTGKLSGKIVKRITTVRERYAFYKDIKIACERKILFSYGAGFHSMSRARLKNCKLNTEQIITECTIPKGSLYYRDKTGLIVSNQIIVNKITSCSTLTKDLMKSRGGLLNRYTSWIRKQYTSWIRKQFGTSIC